MDAAGDVSPDHHRHHEVHIVEADESIITNNMAGSDNDANVVADDDCVDEEARDSFPTSIGDADIISNNNDDDNVVALVDRESLDHIVRSYHRNGPTSVATTELASAIGSVVGRPKKPYLKSITFYKNIPNEESIEWDIQLSIADPTTASNAIDASEGPYNQGSARGSRKPRFLVGSNFLKKKPKLYVSSVGGIVSLSKLQEGDILKSINGKRVDSGSNPTAAMDLIAKSYNDDGMLSLTTGSNSNEVKVDDILIEVTVIKPRPDMTYEELGISVWYWGYLCVRKIEKDSIFKHTILKSNDHIVAINDIQCTSSSTNTDNCMSEEQFAHIINELPLDITLTILRRKQRITGRFG